MPDANALTFLQLQDAVLGRRFPAASQRPNARRWIATAYVDVWSALRADGRWWSFEPVLLSALTVTQADATPTMPSDFGDTLNLYSDAGEQLTRMDMDEFETNFSVPESGDPWAYVVTNRQITLGPTPGASVSFKHSYLRRLAHVESDGVSVSGGFMDEDSDYPLWSDHHAVLIPRAVAIGLQEMNDPTWEQSQLEYERQLARMRADLEYTRPQAQWPREWYA